MENCSFKEATMEDAKTLFDWANDPQTRKNSFQTKPIQWEEHIAWFQNKLQSYNSKLFLFMVQEKEAGMLRLDWNEKENALYISYSIADSMRGKGYGKCLIAKIDALIKEKMPKWYETAENLVAEVKPENKASMKCFMENGYKMTGQTEEELVFTKKIGQKCLVIRADGNRKIGLGHLMRCLTIADEAKVLGMEVLFVLKDAESCEVLRQRGFNWKILENSAWGRKEKHVLWETEKRQVQDQGMSKEIELESFLCFLEELKKEKQDVLVLIDSYEVTPDYLGQVNKMCHSAYLDDLGTSQYPVDVLINYNIYAASFAYEDKVMPDTELLLGCAYVPIRKQFLKTIIKQKEQKKDTVFSKEDQERSGQGPQVLVTTGGTDLCNFMSDFVEKIAKEREKGGKTSWIAPYNFHIVSGAMNTHREELYEKCSKEPQAIFHEKISDLSELMEECDFAVSAAGSTLYEMAVMGTAFVTFSFVENQIQNAEGFADTKLVRNAGKYEKEPEKVMENVFACLKDYEQNRENYTEYAKKLQKLVDGQGAKRIVEAILRKTSVPENGRICM